MPELPEVETMRRGILAAQGSQLVGVESARCRKRPIEISPTLSVFRRKVVGRRITSIGRVGKRVVLHLETTGTPRAHSKTQEPNAAAAGDSIVIEPRMTGLVLLADPPSQEHLRLHFNLEGEGPSRISFWDRRGLGIVRLLSATEFAARLGDTKLGPDALALTPELLRQRLSSSSRPIKVALLDQKAVAGIGNLYASEALHACGLHPALPCKALRPADWRQLQEAIARILALAIEYEGSTLSDGTYRNALNQSGSYQNEHRVYDRAGEACRTCGRGEIERIVQAQRSTFFCSRCQRPRGV